RWHDRRTQDHDHSRPAARRGDPGRREAGSIGPPRRARRDRAPDSLLPAKRRRSDGTAAADGAADDLPLQGPGLVLVGSYETPIPAAAGIASLMCFYPKRVELTVDGEPLA